jgi:threonine/homoserine/homoserine lactone efflux protein
LLANGDLYGRPDYLGTPEDSLHGHFHSTAASTAPTHPAEEPLQRACQFNAVSFQSVIVVTYGSILGVAAISLGMVVTPGPNMLYLASRAVSQGRRAGLASLCGVVVGFLVYLTAAALGLAAAFAALPALSVILRLAGASYLAWLAWKIIRTEGKNLLDSAGLPHESYRKLFAVGLMTNLFNPKAVIIYASLIPHFINRRAGHLVLQGFVLGGVQIVVSVAVNGSVIALAGALAQFLARHPAWLKTQRCLTGGMLGAIAVKLALWP